jgi:hypothetical protein
MSIGAGALALRRFQVLESTRATPLEWIVEKLKSNMISVIGMDEDKEKSLGWCHPFTGDGDLGDVESLIYGDSFLFGLRIDVKRVPGTLFRLQMKAALESMGQKMSEEGEERGKAKRLSKKMREATRDRIKSELLRRTLPNIRLLEVVWHLDSNEVWVTTTSSSALGDFEKLFNETFGIPFVHVNPGTAAVDFARILEGGQTTSLEPLLALVPASFVSHDNHIRSDTVSLPKPINEDMF